MKKLISAVGLFVFSLLLFCSMADAGVVRRSAKVVKKTPRVSVHVVAKTAKVAWKIFY